MIIRILLADPDPGVRAAFLILLKQRMGLCHLEEAADWEKLQQMVASSIPDLLLLDWRLPGLEANGILQAWIDAAEGMLVVGMSINEDDCRPIMEAGAHAFLYKGENPERVIEKLKDLLDYNHKKYTS